MEEQNQQPVQAQTESKRPIKTNWKFIAIVVVLGLVVGGVWLSFQFTSSPAVKQTSLPTSKQVRILQEDQICAVDTDCVLIETDCDRCSCGDTVNKIHQQEYQSQYEMLCKSYRERSGKICDFLCSTPFARCINNRCVLSAEKLIVDTSTPSTSSGQAWQTYRNEEFGFEVRYPDDQLTLNWEMQTEDQGMLTLYPLVLGVGGGAALHKINIVASKVLLQEKLFPASYVKSSQEKIKVAGKDTWKEVWKGDMGFHIVTRVTSDNDIYYRIQGDFSTTESYEKFSRLFDQILSTFRFTETKAVVPVDKVFCEARGGKWEQRGFVGVLKCNLPTSDAGKECTDSSQCESVCIFDETKPNLEPPPVVTFRRSANAMGGPRRSVPASIM